ncbi:hypothetical protein BT69DRAFT_1340141 [Atractiella rhizophila]|nr:hypothetical protein BT69DRAFT_1340141 [Atractiella rhizophila]
MSDQENITSGKNYKELYKASKRQRNDARQELSLLQETVARAEDDQRAWEEERAQLREELEAMKEQLHADEPPSKRRRSTRVVPAAPSKLARLQAYRAGKAAVLLYQPWPMIFDSVFAKRLEAPEYPEDEECEIVSDDEEVEEEEEEHGQKEKQQRNHEREVRRIYRRSNFFKFIFGRLPPEAVEWHSRYQVLRGLAEQKSDNAHRMRNHLADIFDIKSSSSAELKSPKTRQRDEEIQQHIEDESYIYAPHDIPMQCRDSTRKAIKAAAYLRSHALFKIARIIIHGPAALNSANNRARGATISSQLSIRQITIPLIAYSSTLARYTLSSDIAFSAEGTAPIKPGTEETNNYRDHYHRTVTLLSTLEEQHKDKYKDLLSLWNREVFPRDDDEADSSWASSHGHGTNDADILEGFDITFDIEWHSRYQVLRGLAEQKSDNAHRMRNHLADIFDIKSSSSAELKSPKTRQRDEEIQQHIEDESYIYAPHDIPMQCRDSTRKAIKAAAYLRSHALFKIARIIIHGPAALNSANNRARGATISSQLSIRQITIPLIAYSSTLARYTLSSDIAFSAEGTAPIKPGTEETNNYRDHYHRTVTLLSTLEEQHKDKYKDLLSLWNREVFPRDDDEADSSWASSHGHGTNDADILEGFDITFDNDEAGIEE